MNAHFYRRRTPGPAAGLPRAWRAWRALVAAWRLAGVVCLLAGVVSLLAAAASPRVWAHPPPGPKAGKHLGVFELTYYWVAEEKSGGDWPLFAPACARVLARTSRRFHDALSREGTGRLRDGRLLNFSHGCACARPGHRGRRVCYEEVNKRAHPWGKGSRLKKGFASLRPFRTVAVDPRRIPIGSAVFIPLWRNRRAPDGTVMDGCFRAEDTGTAIRGRRVDLFAGRPEWARWLASTYRFRRVAIYGGGRRCGNKGVESGRPARGRPGRGVRR